MSNATTASCQINLPLESNFTTNLNQATMLKVGLFIVRPSLALIKVRSVGDMFVYKVIKCAPYSPPLLLWLRLDNWENVQIKYEYKQCGKANEINSKSSKFVYRRKRVD